MLTLDETILISICEDSGALPILIHLISKNTNVNVMSSRGKTPLHYCVKNNQIAFVQCLLAAGANPNSMDMNGNTPLHYAVKLRLVELIHILTIAGASFKVKNKLAENPISLAVMHGNMPYVEWLQDYQQKLKTEKQSALFKTKVFAESLVTARQTIEQQSELIRAQDNTINNQQLQIQQLTNTLQHLLSSANVEQQPTISTPHNNPEKAASKKRGKYKSKSFWLDSFHKPTVEQQTTTSVIEPTQHTTSQVTPSSLL